MPLDADLMAQEIITALETGDPGASPSPIPPAIPPGDNEITPTDTWRLITGAIVAHIQANADVSVTVPIEAGPPGDFALQTSTSVGAATGPPLVDTSLDGTGGIS